jgi:hypothetical protein
MWGWRFPKREEEVELNFAGSEWISTKELSKLC